MKQEQVLRLKLRRQELITDERGYTVWKQAVLKQTIPAQKAAILICDMWDNHWCRGAVERENAFVERMNEVVKVARQKGVHIIHAPSETMGFYQDHPARARVTSMPMVEPPTDIEHVNPPLPVDDSDGGSDTGETSWYTAWTRQHPTIEIHDEDVISDQGREVYSFLQQEGIERVLIMGVHTGMCILHRTFGIKQMVKWGVKIALVRDLTDSMYNPARSPYVSHEEGTQLIIGYIEKFWCPTVVSKDIVGA